MKKLDVLIVEDSVSFSLELEMLVKKIGYSVVKVLDRAEDALSFIQVQAPDLILMDIDLKGEMTGVDLGRLIVKSKIPIIYITSLLDERHYQAAQASEMIGYLTKPISSFALKAAIETTINNTFFKEKDPKEGNFSFKNFLFFRKKGIYQKIYFHDICYIQSSDNYCEVFTTKNDYFIVRSTISSMYDLLPSSKFFRIHRKYIIQLSQIESINLSNNQLKILSTILPISRKNKKLFEQTIMKLD